MLDLGYPGGINVEKFSKLGDKNFYKLPEPIINKAGCNLSFAGLKTAVLREAKNINGNQWEGHVKYTSQGAAQNFISNISVTGLLTSTSTTASHPVGHYLSDQTGDMTMILETKGGGDPTLILNSQAVNRSGLINFQDQGVQSGQITYKHNGDTMEFYTGGTGASHKELTLNETTGATFRTKGTFGSNITINGGQILTPGGVNLALNPNTGLVSVGGTITATGTGANKFTGGLVLGTPSNGNLVNKLTIASGTNGDGVFLTGLGNANGMGTAHYKDIDYQYSNTDSSFGSAIRFVTANHTAHGGQIEIWTDDSSGNIQKALTLDKFQNATFTASVTAVSLVKSGGTSGQFLMADGSISTHISPNGHLNMNDNNIDNVGDLDFTRSFPFNVATKTYNSSNTTGYSTSGGSFDDWIKVANFGEGEGTTYFNVKSAAHSTACLLYTSPSPRD